MNEDLEIFYAYHRAKILYVGNYHKIQSQQNIREIFCCDCIIEFKEEDIRVIDILPDIINFLNSRLIEYKEEGRISKDEKEIVFERISEKEILILNLYSYACLWTYLEKTQMKHMTQKLYPNNINRPRRIPLSKYCIKEKLI